MKNDLRAYMENKWSSMIASHPFLDDASWKAKRPVVLFGLGLGFTLGARYFAENGYNVRFLCDNDPGKWGASLDGISVISPAELPRLENPVVFIMTQSPAFSSAIARQMKEAGLDHLVFRQYVLLANRGKVFQVLDLLADEKSVRTYAEVLRMHMEDVERCSEDIFDANQYFALPEFVRVYNNLDEIFVDIGAHVGLDTERLLYSRSGVVKKIYCFEPSPLVYPALRARVKRLTEEFGLKDDTIECIQAGCWSSSGFLSFDTREERALSSGSFCSHGAGRESVAVMALDDMFAEEPPSFIKADIEGAERDMLDGARGIIAAHKPKLAICIYHRMQDLFELPLHILRLNPEYTIAVRQHTCYPDETVLYCY